jgi:Mg-chelatase subunit ChlD
MRFFIGTHDKMSTTIPNEFLCPINLSIMKDPAIAPDGHTYERAAITEWLQNNTVSPLTRQQMSASQLRSNHALRQTIEHWVAAHPLALATVAPTFKDVPLSLTAKKYAIGAASFVHVEVSATGPAERQPIVFIAIVDNSGSMGEEASGGDGAESFGFTRLDLVKHTINTIAAILGPQDQIAIVSFSTAARVVLPPTQIDDAGRSKVSAAVATIQPDSQTNIYDGIRQAALIANQPELSGRNIVAALLTDGFPNVNPPRGILQTLKAAAQQPKWSLHTFGFGYKLDSKLLTELADWGTGIYGFIPDCSMVGTVFINFIANMLTTASLGTTLYADGRRLSFTGPIRHGQSWNDMIPWNDSMSLPLTRMTLFLHTIPFLQRSRR